MGSAYLFGIGYLLTAPWLGTQYLAHHYRFAKWLGAPLCTVLGYSLYAPSRLVAWLWKYSGVESAPFDTALILMALWGLPWALLALWWQQRQRYPQTFGTQEWGTSRDLKRAGLFSDAGPVIGRVGRRYLRYKGPMQ